MTNTASLPQIEDLASVGSRVSWSAILAGTVLAIGIYFLLGTLGGAVGLSAADSVSPATVQTGVIAWAFVTTIVALFVGGLITSQFTVGENKVEAVVSGIITWAVLYSVLLLLGAMGVRTGIQALQAAGSANWEANARAAGVSQQQIDEWRRRTVDAAGATRQEAPDRQAVADAATRIGWYAFAASWLSMIAAAAGALVGAGPTFRLVVIPTGVRPVASQSGIPHGFAQT